MARNYLALFIALYLFFVLLGPALVGNQGYWVNRSLQKSITLQQRTLDETSIQLRDLEIRKEQIWDEAHLLDEARNLGYVKKGEQVFYFEDQGTSTAQQPPKQSESALPKVYSGLSETHIRLISLALAAICTLLIWLLRKRAHKNI